jgi:uncharacterized membrane protein
MRIRIRPTLLWGLVLCLALVFVPWVAQASVFDQAPSDDVLSVIDAELLKTIQAEGEADFFVWMKEQADVSGAYQLQTKLEKGQYVFDTLQATAAESQRDLRAYLELQGVAHRPFYVANMVYVYGGSEALLMDLAARPDVDRILPNRQFQLQEPFIDENAPASTAAIEPNISFIRAPEVWNMGITGQGTVMAGGDTGMQWDHPALINHYRGWDGVNADHNYNWWDATGTYPNVPGDGHGHGTHISGTMVGDDGGTNQIGVAPGAQVIHCKNMTNTGSGSDLTFTTCFEFVLAPWDLSGQNPMPSLAPDAMNNSWGYFGGGQGQFATIIENLHAAGILVEVSAGNEGSSCGTLRSPGDYDFVLTTGSVGHASGTLPGTLTGFSSRGPSSLYPGAHIPTIMAPGENIRSSIPGGGYQGGWSGTSMSGPHATALVGLMWSANPALAGMVEETMQMIIDTAVPLTGVSGSNCGGDYTTGPNNDWGYGTIDALAAVEAAMLFGGTGTLEGTVNDATTSGPLEGVEIAASLSPTMTWTTSTNADGYYNSFVLSGTYTVTASLFAYLPQTVTDVQVTEDMTTTLDFQLQPAPSAVISGTVTDVNTGWPLYASIAVDGVPGSPFWTDPATGFYSITLPEGVAYDFTVSAFVDGYLPEMFSVGPVDGDMTVNVELDVNAAICIAPGYQPGAASGDFYDFEADDGGFVGTEDWEWGTDYNWTAAGCDGTTNFPPPGAFSGVGMWATHLNGCYGNTGTFHILSFSADLTGQSSAILQWWDWYDVFETFDFGEVRANGDLVYDRATSYDPSTEWEQHQVDLTPYAGGMVDIEFRMFATTVVNRAGWYIDDVLVGEPSCTPQAGGLVVGNVYDDNTNEGLNGAQVVNDSGYMATAVATPSDPAVDDAFYTIFAPEGSAVLTATYSSDYGIDTANLTIPDGTTQAHDFNLPAGWIDIDPEALDVTVEFGSMATFPLTLTNLGGLPADFALSTLLLEEHFEGDFPPDGWSVIDNGGNCVWQRNDQVPNGRPNHAGGDGFSAAADSDRCGSGTTMNTELHTPVMDLSGATVATLDFVASYRHLSTSSFAVDISTDGGSNWDNLLLWTASVDPTGPGFPVSLDLTPYVGSSNTVVRFHYTAPGWHWWAQVDQIQILADTGAWLSLDPAAGSLPPSGGQVVVDAMFNGSNVPEPGQYMTSINVDHNTPYTVAPIDVTMNVIPSDDMGTLEGTVTSQGYCDTDPFPLVGADVLIESATNTWNRTTDENGFYNLFVNAAQSPLTVTVSAPAHEVGLETDVIITAQMTTTVDFDLRWLVPCISTSDDSLSATVDSGESETMTFTIFNDGGGDANFEIGEQDGGYGPTAAAPGQVSDIGDEWEMMAPLPAGRVFNAVIADQNGYVYVIGGTSDAGGNIPTNTNYRYNTATNSWDTMAPLPVAMSQINGIEINNKIYIPGDTNTATTYVYDIASDSWSSIPASGGYTARVFYNVVSMGNDLYVLGGIVSGASTAQVWKLDTATETWTAGVPMQRTRINFAAEAIDGAIYVAGGVAFPGFAPDMTAEKFDGDSWSFIAGVPDGGGAYTRWSYHADGHGADGLWLAAGRRDTAWNVLDHAGYYDPDTDSWTTSPDIPLLAQPRVYMEGDVATDGYFYVIGGRDSAGAIIYTTNERLYVGSPVSTDVFWLSQDPESGVVPADDSFDVEITFTAFPTMPLGTYTATMSVFTNDPVNGRIDVPVTMVVTGDAVYNPVIAPDTAADSGDPGEVVVYDLTVTNMGNSPDTISLSLAGNEWDTELSADSVGLLPGESIDVTVAVTIAADAMGGETDMVTVTAVSDNDPSAMSASELTTTANAAYGVGLDVMGDDELYDMPGETVMFDLRITNAGNVPDMFELYYEDNDWAVELSIDMTDTLDPGDWVDVNVMVTIPPDAMMDDWDTVMVFAKSMGDPDHWDSAMLTTVTMAMYGVTLSPDSAEQSGLPGEVMTYTLTVANVGNADDSFSFTASGNDWNVTLPMTVMLDAGESVEVVVTVEIPVSALDGEYDVVTITATSAGDEAVTASSELTTTAEVEPGPGPEEFILYLPFVIRP